MNITTTVHGPYTFENSGSVSYTTTEDKPSTVVYEELPEFKAYRKIPRLFRDVVITEKIDGTNAQVYITEDGRVYAGKRSSWITPDKDNFGFAAWVEANKEELKKLGPGHHYGEWYGKGINRGYGLQDRRFALFNSSIDCNTLPACVGVVPVLWSGAFSTNVVRECVSRLAFFGSAAVPGFLKPEGVVVYHAKAGQLFKVTLENDDQPKGVTE